MFDPSAPRLWDRESDDDGPEPLREDEFAYLISFAKRALWSPPDVRRRIQDHGINITPANFYSEVPLVTDIEGSFEYDMDPPPYVDLFDHDRVARTMEHLAPHAEEFAPPRRADPDDPAQFHWDNPAFSRLDAMAYYCMLRHLQPDRVVEIGAGWSTLVADMALRANGTGTITVIEPYPKDFLEGLPSVERLVRRPVQDFPVEELVDLVDGSDVLFIDSTHTVKIGSDCLYIYLQLLPRLQEPVIAHSHDVFLPFGMPRDRALERHVYWTEQYLLAALLHGDPGASVLFGAVYALTYLQAEAREMMHGRATIGGASLWYALNGAAL